MYCLGIVTCKLGAVPHGVHLSSLTVLHSLRLAEHVYMAFAVLRMVMQQLNLAFAIERSFHQFFGSVTL